MSTCSSIKRSIGIVIGVIIIVAILVFAYALTGTSTRKIETALPQEGSADMAKLIDDGRYVAVTGDCIACHTAKNGTDYAGGLGIASPIGTIYSTNITPDKETGIGDYSLDDFDRAVRHGITPNGDSLYPAMPYPSYARMTDDDVKALYAYFMHEVKPVHQENKAADIPWPMSMRWPLAIWRKTFAPASDTPPTIPASSNENDSLISRGAYLVEGAGHCGTCHTPRASTMQEKALDNSSQLYLSGGQIIDGWLAVNLRGNNADGLGRWSVQDIIDTLKTGRNPHAAVIGSPMNDVVTHSTQHMTDNDLKAIAVYLKSLSPSPNDPSSYQEDETTAKALQSGQNINRGAQLYVDNCAACHRTDAKGYTKAFPAIAGNPTVLAADPTSLIHVILKGSAMASTETRPSNLGMPGFDWRLSDDEVAQLATFARQSWGNHASAVSASEVANIRKTVEQETTQH